MLRNILRRITGRQRQLPTTTPSTRPRHRYFNPFFPRERVSVPTQPRNDFWIYLLILIFLSGFVVYFFNAVSYFKIDSISVSGNHYIATGEIEKIVNDSLSKKWFFILEKNSYWLVSTAKLTDALNDRISDSFALKNVKVTKKFPRSVSVEIEERIPRLVWVTNNQYFYIDPTGVITQKIHPDELDPDFPKIFDHNNLPVNVNEQVISESMAQLALALRERLEGETTIALDTFFVPPIACQKRDVVQKEVSIRELEETEAERVESEKKAIQKQLQAGEITVEESLEMLEALDESREYTSDADTSSNNTNGDDTNSVAAPASAGNLNTNTSLEQIEKKIVFEEVYIPSECDLPLVAHDLNVRTIGGWDIYFSDQLDLNVQIQKLKTVLAEKYSEEPRYLSYIDLRYEDKVYYQ